MKKWTFVFMLGIFFSAFGQKTIQLNDSLKLNADLMYSEDFSEGMENWYPEIMPGGEVKVSDQAMEIDVPGGCTVWYLKKLNQPVMIEYEVVVLDEGGPNDRVSDLNCFWMAQDPENTDDFFKNSENRGGKFNNYNPLRLYYVGVGGHNNTKTRFRRYMGDGTKPLLPEHDLSDEKHLIKANTLNKIRLAVFGNIVQYYRNGELIFDFYDPEPYSSGYFGIRTVENHMTVDNVKIYRLEAN